MFHDILDENLIIINPKVKNKKELFEKMVNHVYNYDYIRHQKDFYTALSEREKMANTELIAGVALPHARSDAVEKLFLCIITSKEGIDYEHETNGPAQIIFFLGCTNSDHKEYLQLLAKSSRLLKKEEIRNKIIQAESKQEIISILNQFSDNDNGNLTEEQSYTMILTLNKVEKSSDVLSSMVEAGITNATILEGYSMAKKMAYELPVFAGLSYMSQGRSKETQLIISHIQQKKSAKNLVEILKDNGIDLLKKGVGFIQLIPVSNIIGNHEEDVDW